MVTASCNTADSAFVIYEISPRKILVPRLYMMAIPMLARKMTGIIQESSRIIIATTAQMTASPT